MALVDLNKPGEKKKLIWAAVLGLVAIIFLWWTFFGFGSSSSRSTQRAANPSPTPRATGQNSTSNTGNGGQQASADVVDLSHFRPIDYQRSSYDAPEARRNIFAYYVPPKPTPAPKIEAPPPSPTPTPPILLASISPSNAYARAPEFKTRSRGRQVHSPDAHLCRRQGTSHQVHQSAATFCDGAGDVYRQSRSAPGHRAHSRQQSLLQRHDVGCGGGAHSQLQLRGHHR